MAWYDTVWDFVTGAADTVNKYQGLAKTGIAALSTYASYKDQKKKNELQQDAYRDYMAAAEAAGREAEAAVDLNLTPMTISGTPTTKAEVTDYTAATGLKHGGISSLRKGYARGPEEFEVEQMDEEEIITPDYLMKEEGVNIGPQVFYNTGRGDRANALMIWDQMSTPDKSIFDFDFEIFFQDGGWRDMIKGEAPNVQGDRMMASNDQNTILLEQLYDQYLELGLSPAEAAKKAQEEFDNMGQVPVDQQGIMQAAKGGIAGLRKGYEIGDIVTADTEAVVSNVPQSQVDQIQGSQMTEQAYNEIFRKFYERFPNIDTENMTLADMVAMLQAEGVMAQDLGILGLDSAMGMITPQSAEKSAQKISMGDTQWGEIPYAKGGRIGYARGPDEFEVEQMDEEIVTPFDLKNEEGVPIGPMASFDLKEWIWESKKQRFSNDMFGKDYEDLTPDQKETIDIHLEMELGKKPGDPEQPPIYLPKPGEEPQGVMMAAKGGRIRRANGGIMDMGGLEKDYRFSGGFVPIGEYEKKDDVPARLSKNEFVFTADAVRAAGGGNINKGAKRMYETMKNLEAQPTAKRMIA